MTEPAAAASRIIIEADGGRRHRVTLLGEPLPLEQLAGQNIPREIDVSALAVAPWQQDVFVAAQALTRPNEMCAEF